MTDNLTEATLVDRLRKGYNRAVQVAYRANFPRASASDELMREAADKIEELEQERDALLADVTTYKDRWNNRSAACAEQQRKVERLRALLKRCELELPRGTLRDELWKECGE